jgi:hypothetical protein
MEGYDSLSFSPNEDIQAPDFMAFAPGEKVG